MGPTMKRLLFALLVLPAAMSATAQDLDDLDAPTKKNKTKTASRGNLEAEVVREIERGWFLKTGVGGGMFMLNYGPLGGYPMLDAGTTLSMGAGRDFIDQETQSMSWAIDFQQGIFNGEDFRVQPQTGRPPTSYIQGDTRTYALLASVEYSKYITRRFGIGGRAGAGLMFAPLLMEPEAYADVVRDDWGGVGTTVHEQPHPQVFFGPTVEYYTKLSHFSIGIDVDFSYALWFDAYVGGQGYLKYTF